MLIGQILVHLDARRQVRFGDGSEMRDDVVNQIRDAYRAAAVSLQWERSDVLLVDETAVAYGRTPLTGSGTVIAATS